MLRRILNSPPVNSAAIMPKFANKEGRGGLMVKTRGISLFDLTIPSCHGIYIELIDVFFLVNPAIARAQHP
jgi:hypothetical protein